MGSLVGEISNSIAGGIEVGATEIIITGGQEYAVGGDSGWAMRDKFLRLKHLSTSKNMDEKKLLKIVGLSIPVTFNEKVYYDDTDTKKQVYPSHGNKNIHDISIEILSKRLGESLDSTAERMVKSFGLKNIAECVLGDIVKLLASINKKKRKNPRKIKISTNMSICISDKWKGENYFQYGFGDGLKKPENIVDLIIHMFEAIERTRPPKGKWEDPKLIPANYPCICKINLENITAVIENERLELEKKADDGIIQGIEVVQGFVLLVLEVENMLLSHVEKIENYYITVAKNLETLLTHLKKFFKP